MQVHVLLNDDKSSRNRQLDLQDQVVYFENFYHRFMSTAATEKPESLHVLF